LQGTNILAYYASSLLTKKSIITSTPGANAIKLFSGDISDYYFKPSANK